MLSVLRDVIVDMIYEVVLFIKNNLRNAAMISAKLLPWVMFIIGTDYKVPQMRSNLGVAIGVYFSLVILTSMLNRTANKIGKGISVPVPVKRFTEYDEEDSAIVSIDNRRTQELILYLADLEDWLERKGLL